MAGSKVAINNLDPDHWDAVQHSIQHILSTKIAEDTFAQTVDGIPTRYGDRYRTHPYTPEVHERDDPSSAALDMVTTWRSNFQPESLMIDSEVVQAFQDTVMGTRDFHLRLIEITAVALHTIAAYLFLHTNKPPYKRPQIPVLDEAISQAGFSMAPVQKIPEKPTYLYHQNYIYHEQYPLGVSDMVGYWAEYQVFGGVVLFDRGPSETEFRDVFLHPSANFRVFRLSEAQIEQFVAFSLHGDKSIQSPFPMEAERYAVRIEPQETFALHIFRNKYERNPPAYFPWVTNHPRRRLEDDPDGMEFLEFVRQRYGN